MADEDQTVSAAIAQDLVRLAKRYAADFPSRQSELCPREDEDVGLSLTPREVLVVTSSRICCAIRRSLEGVCVQSSWYELPREAAGTDVIRELTMVEACMEAPHFEIDAALLSAVYILVLSWWTSPSTS